MGRFLNFMAARLAPAGLSSQATEPMVSALRASIPAASAPMALRGHVLRALWGLPRACMASPRLRRREGGAQPFGAPRGARRAAPWCWKPFPWSFPFP